MFGLVHTHCGA